MTGEPENGKNKTDLFLKILEVELAILGGCLGSIFSPSLMLALVAVISIIFGVNFRTRSASIMMAALILTTMLVGMILGVWLSVRVLKVIQDVRRQQRLR